MGQKSNKDIAEYILTASVLALFGWWMQLATGWASYLRKLLFGE